MNTVSKACCNQTVGNIFDYLFVREEFFRSICISKHNREIVRMLVQHFVSLKLRCTLRMLSINQPKVHLVFSNFTAHLR